MGLTETLLFKKLIYLPVEFEKSIYSKKLSHFKLEMPFGYFYLCKNFFIGEFHEGVHFDWKKAELLIPKIMEFYGENIKIAYIANRVNSYSIDPRNWIKIEKTYNLLVASAIVIYSNSIYMNATLEKLFTKKSIKRCLTLNEAINWVENLREFKVVSPN